MFKNKLFKLLIIKEQGGNWQKYLEDIILTLLGFEQTNEIFIILGRLCSLQFLEYPYFRSTIFDLMPLIEKAELKLCIEKTTQK